MYAWRLPFTDLFISVLPVSTWDVHTGLVNLVGFVCLFFVLQAVLFFLFTQYLGNVYVL